MHDQPDPTQRTGNLLLDALSVEGRTRLLADADTRAIVVGGVLFRPGDPVTYVAFPTSGTLSLLAQPEDSQPVEAATIGREGAASVHSALGSHKATQELVGQVEGRMITVGVEVFNK